MKNLLIHLNGPGYEWQKEVEPLLKIQIENSLRFLKKEDIILITNFDYEYLGVKARKVDAYCDWKPTVSKVLAILKIIENDIYWFHDLDAFQLEPLDFTLEKDMALTDYGVTTIRESYNSRWSTGSWFFKKEARDIFFSIVERSAKDGINEEAALGRLVKEDPSILDRIEKLNITYNFATRKRDVEKNMEIVDKPIKVLHFHPHDKRPLSNGMTNMEYCFPLMSPELQAIFKKHL